MGDYWNEDVVRTSVANQKLDIEGEHPAPFPEEIITLPILQTSKEFELILDPFMGSGTATSSRKGGTLRSSGPAVAHNAKSASKESFISLTQDRFRPRYKYHNKNMSINQKQEETNTLCYRL